jgi:surface protein
MSFRNVQQNSIDNRNTQSVPPSAAGRGAGGGWIRNPSWLAMPTSFGTHQVDMLVPVYPESTFIAFTFFTSGGNYLVDWGDGSSVSVVASGTAAQKQYTYSTAALDGTNAPVTFQQTANTVTRTSHGYPNGYPISFASITTTTGITATQIYYVINATTDTFQLAASRGGAALTLTNDGTGIILPYKQAIIKVYTSSANLTSCNLQVKNTTTGLQAYAMPIMDLTLTLPSASSIIVNGTTTPPRLLEKITVRAHNVGGWNGIIGTNFAPGSAVALQSVTLPFTSTGTITNLNNAFANCPALQTAPFFSASSVTRTDFMFASCTSLQTLPLYNFSSVSNASSMFSGCAALQTTPLFNTPALANTTNMFSGCASLQTVPLYNTANLTVATSMFNNCYSLQTIPQFNTINATNTSNMFYGCTSLYTLPQLNTSNVTNITGMFTLCTSLQTIPLLDTAKVTDMTQMFNSCTSLQAVPLFNTANVTNTTQMFVSCTSLQTAPQFNTANVTNATSMYNGCNGLQTIPAANCASLVTTTTTFSSCTSLSSIGGLTNLINTVDISSLKLSGTSLDTVYTSLGRVGGSCTFQASPTNTVTITGHGYTGGESIRFSVITTTTGISINTTYWVRNTTTDTFQLSATPTGAILTLTNNGTGTRAPATITVSGNWGIATDTPAIATAKGWTVTGS